MPDPLVTSWISNSRQYSVSTARMQGEGDQEFQSRHDDAVVFWQGVYPPD